MPYERKLLFPPFQKGDGGQFVDFVNQRKIRKAADLLQNTNLRINEVAAQIGIDNPNYFSVLLKSVKERPRRNIVPISKTQIKKDNSKNSNTTPGKHRIT